MKLLLEFLLVLILISPFAQAQDEVVVEDSVVDEVVVQESEIAPVERVAEGEGSSSEATTEESLSHKLAGRRYMRCTMDRNKWGYSSHCECGPGFKYKAKIGKCIKVVAAYPDKPTHRHDRNKPIREGDRIYKFDEEPAAESEGSGGGGFALEGCEGGTFSHDLQELTCPDGRVYEEKQNTLGQIARDVTGELEYDSSSEIYEEDSSDSSSTVSR